jgi:hypothetical protein
MSAHSVLVSTSSTDDLKLITSDLTMHQLIIYYMHD